MTKQSNNNPLETLRDGYLKATIWENQREGKTYRSVDLYRTYKNNADESLKEISNYSGSELLRIARLSQNAYDKLVDFHQADK